MNRSLPASLLLLATVALAAPVPKVEKGENKLYVTINGTVVKMNPDGTKQEKLSNDWYTGHDVSLSPDGKSVLSCEVDGPTGKQTIFVRGVGGKPKELGEAVSGRIFWTADSKSLIGYDFDQARARKPKAPPYGSWKSWRIDLETGKRTNLDLPGECQPQGITSDGKCLICEQETGTRWVDKHTGVPRLATVTTPLENFDPTLVISDEIGVETLAAFPDGKRWLVRRRGVTDDEIGVYTMGEKEPVVWETHFDPISPGPFAISPDGKQVAYRILVAEVKDGRPSSLLKSTLWVSNADGSNAKKVLTPDSTIGHIEWR